MLCNYLAANRSWNRIQSVCYGLAIVVAGICGAVRAAAADAEQAEPAVIRVATAEGTLVVRVDDPKVSVRVEGNELIVTGAGLEELRVATSDLKANASEDGRPTPETVVSITRGEKEIVS